MLTGTHLDAAHLAAVKIRLSACDSFRKPEDEQLFWALTHHWLASAHPRPFVVMLLGALSENQNKCYYF